MERNKVYNFETNEFTTVGSLRKDVSSIIIPKSLKTVLHISGRKDLIKYFEQLTIHREDNISNCEILVNKFCLYNGSY